MVVSAHFGGEEKKRIEDTVIDHGDCRSAGGPAVGRPRTRLRPLATIQLHARPATMGYARRNPFGGWPRVDPPSDTHRSIGPLASAPLRRKAAP